MPTPVVWSERDDPGGAWRDCTYSAGLMALVHAGEAEYPLGVYTAAEREALERSDSRADETGANAYDLDQAIRNRYNRELHRPVWQGLGSLLDTPGLCLVLPGYPANLGAGHWLRRWDPGFAGGHRIAVLTLRGAAADEVLWLDPLAPWRYPGDVTNRADVWAFFGTMPVAEIRYSVLDEWAPAPEPPPPPPPPPVDVALEARRAEYDRLQAEAVPWRRYDRPSRRYVLGITWPARP